MSSQLLQDLENANCWHEAITTKDGDQISYAEFYGAGSKPIIDQIDRLLADHYQLDEAEADFIINYDLKYRTGGGDDDPADDGS